MAEDERPETEGEPERPTPAEEAEGGAPEAGMQGAADVAEVPAPEAPADDDAPAAERETSADEPLSEEERRAASVRLRSIVESLLFAAAEPVGIGKLEKIARGYDRKAIAGALGALAAEYEDGERGIRLVQVAGGWQLRTPRENAELVRQLREVRPVRLSRPALETLAIVAYRQPVTRAEIEAIRGVDVDAVMATLLERRLVRVLGRKDVIGHPLLYGTSAEFLETFGLKDLKSLPTLDELGASVEALERAAASAEAVLPLESPPPATADGEDPGPSATAEIESSPAETETEPEADETASTPPERHES
jgi:segregation and condensation protein B